MCYYKNQDHDQLLEGLEFFPCEQPKSERASSRPSGSRSPGVTTRYLSIGAAETRRANLVDTTRSLKARPLSKPLSEQSNGGNGNITNGGSQMSEPIKPALTAEEWEIALSSDSYVPGRGFGDWLASRMPSGHGPYTPHEIAAYALYDQPFGFRREDVRILRELEVSAPFGPATETYRALASLADRLEALLPPEK